MKKLLSIILTVALLAGVLPGTALAADQPDEPVLLYEMTEDIIDRFLGGAWGQTSRFFHAMSALRNMRRTE
ncbi:MAG: hypothetical protein FWG31_09650 [Oscillospiraceae bacterium]|nr:hypothetical protein [Oscillospiraceae bacterium]